MENSDVVSENMGPVAIIYDHWTYLSMFTRSDRRETDDFLKSCVHMATQMCDTLMQSSAFVPNNTDKTVTIRYGQTSVVSAQLDGLPYARNCRSSVAVIHSLATRTIDVGEKLDVLLKSYRTKRGIRPLGALLKWAFDTLDATDDERYTAMFAQLARNANTTFNLVHEQITLIRSTMQKLLDPIRNLEQDQANLQSTLNKVIDNLTNTTVSLSQKVDVLMVRTEVNAFLESVTLKLEEISLARSEEIQTLDALVSHTFHHNMIDLPSFRMEFKRLVESKDNNYLALDEPPYSLIQVDTMTLQDNIYMKLRLPMASDDVYDVKKLYPVAQPLGNGWCSIPDFATHYVATNQRDRKFITWDEADAKCNKVRWRHSNSISLCETTAIVQTGDSLDCLGPNEHTCRRKVIRTPRTWVIAMSKPNTWLVMLHNRTTFQAACKGSRDTLSTVLATTGIMEILLPCNVMIGNTTLMFRRQIAGPECEIKLFTGSGQFPELPQWNNSLMMTINSNATNVIPKLQVSTHHQLSDTLTSAIKDTQRLELAWQHENNVRINQLRFHDIDSHSWFIWGLLAAMVLIFVAVSVITCYIYRQQIVLRLATSGIIRMHDLTGVSRSTDINLPALEA